MVRRPCLDGLYSAAIIAAVVCVITFFVTTRILGHQGKQQSEDEITGGRQLTDDPKAVAKMLRRDGLASDIKIGELPLIKDSRSRTSVCTVPSGPVNQKLSAV